MRSIFFLLGVFLLASPFLAGAQEIISNGPGPEPANGASSEPAFSADGRYVAFASRATNLTAGDTNNRKDVFVIDRQDGRLQRVSVASDGSEGDADSFAPVLSADGRFVVFLSQASNLAPGDSGQMQKLLVRDRVGGTTSLLSVTLDGLALNGNCLPGFSLSADGRYVVFDSYAGNLLENDTNNTKDVVLVDRGPPAADGAFTDVPVLSRVGADGAVVLTAGTQDGAISADGDWIVFASATTELAGTAGDAYLDVFVKNRRTGQLTRITDATGGDNRLPRISGDGSRIVFRSRSDNLVSGDGNSVTDVFLYTVADAQLTLISRHSDGTPSSGASDNPRISDDGRYITFESEASNLANSVPSALRAALAAKQLDSGYDAITAATGSGSGGGPVTVVVTYSYLFDRDTGIMHLISRGVEGRLANNSSLDTTLSGGGQWVGMDSVATNLVCNDANGYGDVFISDVADLDTVASCGGETTAAATGGSGGGTGAWSSVLLVIMVVFLCARRRRIDDRARARRALPH